MIVILNLSNKFLTDIILKKICKNENFSNFIKKISDDESIFILGDKKYLEDQIFKYKDYLKKEHEYKTIEIVIKLWKKHNWLSIDSKNNIPFDFSIISESDTINSTIEKNKLISFKKIKNNSKKIINEIDKIKHEIFDIELKTSAGYKKYGIKKKEINKFKDKLLKSTIASKKIIIWDQYIPNSLAYIQSNHKKYNSRVVKGKYHNDYCNTLKFLEEKIFSKAPTENFCEIITMNKLQENEKYQKLSKDFESIAQSYLSNLKLTSSKLIIKDYNPDIWVELHSRLIIFKDGFNQLISYFIIEPGVDFIKLEDVTHYSKKGKNGLYEKTNKFRYRFTPGNRNNFNSKIDVDLQKISKQSGIELKNTA